MTSAVVLAALLAAAPESDGRPDRHAVFAKAQQVMLGGARLPWLLLVSGSIARSREGKDSSDRFVIDWEPCGRVDSRNHLSRESVEILEVAIGVLCGADAASEARVERNGAQIQYVWDRGNRYSSHRVRIGIDPDTGLLSRARVERTWTKWDGPSAKLVTRSGLVGTAQVSDFRPVGTMRLPYRLQLQAGTWRENWTIERIEIVPLP